MIPATNLAVFPLLVKVERYEPQGLIPCFLCPATDKQRTG